MIEKFLWKWGIESMEVFYEIIGEVKLESDVEF